MTARDVAIVVGVGPGLGAGLCRKFTQEGFAIAAAARNADALKPLTDELGPDAHAVACDAAVEDQVEGLFDRVADELGEPSLVVFNAGAFVHKSVLETEVDEFERCWRIGCLGGFLVGRAAARRMLPRSRGTIVFTGATASLRGSAKFHNLAVPKFGLRALAQSMARELQPRGIHVAHVIIDGQILSPRYEALAKDRPEDGLLAPDAIADAYWQLHTQARSAWTQELDLRPWVEKW